jgi:hypothetical protein
VPSSYRRHEQRVAIRWSTMSEREHEVQHEPQVLEGEDEVPRQPSLPHDPYIPEPGPRPGERRAFHVLALAFIPILIVIGIILWAALH